MKYSICFLLLFVLFDGFGQDNDSIIYKNFTGWNLAHSSPITDTLYELPKDEYTRQDTIMGVVRTINADGIETITKGIKVLNVYKHWYLEFPEQPHFGSMVFAVYVPPKKNSKEMTEVKAIVSGMRTINLDKWYEFIPLNKLQ